MISLNNLLFKNIPHVGSFWHFVLCCICVFVYFVIVFFVFVRLTHESIIFNILEQSSFQKYTTCWVFLALRHMLYLCICVFCICIFVFARLTHGNIIFDTLEQSSFQKYAICWVFPALVNVLYLCICVFVFVHFCNTSRSNHYIDLAGPGRSACLKIIFYCWNQTVSLFLSVLCCYEVFFFLFLCEIFFVGLKCQSELTNRLCLLLYWVACDWSTSRVFVTQSELLEVCIICAFLY